MPYNPEVTINITVNLLTETVKNGEPFFGESTSSAAGGV